MAEPKPLGLYIHIPFCKKKCPYCAFYKEIKKKESESDLIDALLCDLESYAPHNPRFTTVFLGGGTPTLLKPDSLKKLMDGIKTKASFTPDCEITIEANPETISVALLDLLADLGINRISLGVQSFNQKDLDFLGRWHSPATIHSALHTIRSHRKNWNLNIDLIFGIPNGSLVTDSVSEALQYAPQHLSTYGLTIEPDTLFAKKNIKNIQDDDELKQFQSIIKQSLAQNFIQYEVSAFAKDGFYCKHNLLYWNFEDFIGIGPSATSFFQNHRYTQKADLEAYLKNPHSDFVTQQSSPLSSQHAMVEYIIAKLRLNTGLSLPEFESKFNVDFEKQFEKQLTILFEKNLLQKTENTIQKTESGLFLLNEILITFI